MHIFMFYTDYIKLQLPNMNDEALVVNTFDF